MSFWIKGSISSSIFLNTTFYFLFLSLKKTSKLSNPRFERIAQVCQSVCSWTSAVYVKIHVLGKMCLIHVRVP